MKKFKSPPKARQRTKPKFPRGWNQKRVQAVIDYYDRQTDEEGAAEYEAGTAINGQSMMLVPTELIPEIEKFIAVRKSLPPPKTRATK